MSRELNLARQAERSLVTTYRKELWVPFVSGIKQYALLREGDRVAVCVSGGKDSMVLAELMQVLHRYSDFPFELKFLCMDPGYSPENRRQIEENARALEIPLELFETDIFQVADQAEKNPCYLCARMRRGHLYRRARDLGCNKIALGHHLNDVIETTVMAMFYGAQLQGMMPKVHSQNFPGMELIRPLYRVREGDILRWQRRHELTFLRCACRLTRDAADGVGDSKRQEIKELLARLKRDNPALEQSLFNSLHAVNSETFPGWKDHTGEHSFLEWYDQK